VESRNEPLEILVLEVQKELAQMPLARPAVEPPSSEFQLPKRSGKSRQGAPVLAIHSTASRTGGVPGGDTRLSCPSGQQVFDALPVLVADCVAVQHGSSSSQTVTLPLFAPSL